MPWPTALTVSGLSGLEVGLGYMPCSRHMGRSRCLWVKKRCPFLHLNTARWCVASGAECTVWPRPHLPLE